MSLPPRPDALSRATEVLARAAEERALFVALIARMALALDWPVGVAPSDPAAGEALDRVVIDLPTGQASWRLLSVHRFLISELPKYGGKLDGATPDERDERICQLIELTDALRSASAPKA